MDIGDPVRRLAAMLDEIGARNALIGGHAMAAYGRARRTFDVDFAVEASASEAVVARMLAEGYSILHRSAGYSNHVHPDPAIGRVDFVYVAGSTADRLFGDGRSVTLDDGYRVRVPRPEHLASMKIFAMRNDPSRTFSELADIAFLARIPGVDRDAIAREFARNGLEEAWNEIARSL